MYKVTRLFTSGLLEGQTHTSITNVPFELGKTYTNCIGKGSYKIIAVENITKIFTN